MLNDARQFLREAPWYGIAIRDALDPRLMR
jgi:hypothetical protein